MGSIIVDALSSFPLFGIFFSLASYGKFPSLATLGGWMTLFVDVIDFLLIGLSSGLVSEFVFKLLKHEKSDTFIKHLLSYFINLFIGFLAHIGCALIIVFIMYGSYEVGGIGLRTLLSLFLLVSVVLPFILDKKGRKMRFVSLFFDVSYTAVSLMLCTIIYTRAIAAESTMDWLWASIIVTTCMTVLKYLLSYVQE